MYDDLDQDHWLGFRTPLHFYDRKPPKASR